MKAAEGRLGRVFVLRLEDGDRVPEAIESFAREKNIEGAVAVMLGGAGSGRLVVGPEDGDKTPVTPMIHELLGVHEIAAVGTIFPSDKGPRLHMHSAMGRGDQTRTGCVRQGIEVWKIAEVVVIEITGTGLARKLDPKAGFEVLSV